MCSECAWFGSDKICKVHCIYKKIFSIEFLEKEAQMYLKMCKMGENCLNLKWIQRNLFCSVIPVFFNLRAFV